MPIENYQVFFFLGKTLMTKNVYKTNVKKGHTTL